MTTLTTAFAYDQHLADLITTAHRRKAVERRRAHLRVVETPSEDDFADLNALLDDAVAELDAQDAETDPAIRSDKSVNSGRRFSLLDEAPFAQDLQAFACGRIAGLQAAGAVSYRGKALSLSHPLTSTSSNDNAAALLVDLDQDIPETPVKTRRVRRPWFTYLPAATSRRRAPAWRFLSDHTKADAALYAARAAGHVWAFTLNLSDDVEALTRAQDRAADYMGRKVDRNLKAAGIEPLTATIIEDRVGRDEFDDRRLHVHGWLVAGADQKDAVIEALAAAGGRAPRGVRLEAQPDAGWSTYCLKGLFWTRVADRLHPAFAPSFNGSPIKISASLRREAEAFYKASTK